MRHVDPKRRRGHYCNAKCVLCAIAAVWTLEGSAAGADAILAADPGARVTLKSKKPGQIGGFVSGIRRRLGITA
jgi:hypothetical protein